MRGAKDIRGWPVRKAMCSTCPFLPDGDRELADQVRQRCLTGSQICHHPVTKGEEEFELCRGARDWQLTVFYRMGVLSAPTDEAWAETSERLKEGDRNEDGDSAL